MNGKNTLGENISDNAGTKEAYYAYNSWEERNGIEPRLPGLSNYTSQQMFWIQFANIQCTKFYPDFLKTVVLTNPHSPSEFRVNGVLSNMLEFSNDFKCPPNSRMNPSKKCVVW